jgi:hypothetical protein
MGNNEIAMCYNVAINKIWGEIFNIKTLDDVVKRLKDVYKRINYIDGHGKSGWNTDQLDLYKYVMLWHIQTNNFIYLNDNQTGYNRLDRNTFILNNNISEKIKNGLYSDYHAYRPYKQYKEINDNIINLLQKN